MTPTTQELRAALKPFENLDLGNVDDLLRVCFDVGQARVGEPHNVRVGDLRRLRRAAEAYAGLRGSEEAIDRNAILEEAALEAERDTDENGSVWIRPYHEIAEAIRAMKVFP